MKAAEAPTRNSVIIFCVSFQTHPALTTTSLPAVSPGQPPPSSLSLSSEGREMGPSKLDQPHPAPVPTARAAKLQAPTQRCMSLPHVIKTIASEEEGNPNVHSSQLEGAWTQNQSSGNPRQEKFGPPSLGFYGNKTAFLTPGSAGVGAGPMAPYPKSEASLGLPQ